MSICSCYGCFIPWRSEVDAEFIVTTVHGAERHVPGKVDISPGALQTALILQSRGALNRAGRLRQIMLRYALTVESLFDETPDQRPHARTRVLGMQRRSLAAVERAPFLPHNFIRMHHVSLCCILMYHDKSIFIASWAECSSGTALSGADTGAAR